jgi:3-hydroxyisobutyrate dehydrogenase
MTDNAAVAVLGSGMEVRVWNRTREKAQPLAGDGASVADSAGTRLKLVVNNWIVGLLGVLAETVAFAETTGVDPARFLEVIEGGPLGLPYAQLKGKMMIEDEFPTSFSLKLARKDAGLVLDAATARGLRMAIAEAVAGRFDEAIEAGHGEEDLAAVYRAATP